MKTLATIGLSAETIARFVVSVNREPGRDKSAAKNQLKIYARREERRRLGQNVLTGEPLKRSPNRRNP